MEERWRKLQVEGEMWRKHVEGNMKERREASGEKNLKSHLILVSPYLIKVLF